MNNFIDYTKQVFLGRTIYRILFNWQVKANVQDLKGRALDLAGDKRQSYYKYFSKNLDIVSSNISEGKADEYIDFDKPLPFENDSFDSVFLFNAIYIAKNPHELFLEIKRIVKKDGVILVALPFISNVMPEPHDYGRFTKEGLEKMFNKAGLEKISINAFGGPFESSAYLLHKFFMLSVIRFFVYGLVITLDYVIGRFYNIKERTPLGYFCIIKK